MIGHRFFIVLIIILTTIQGNYIFQRVCQSSFADSNNLFCISAYDDIGLLMFDFFIPISEKSKIFIQTSIPDDTLVFYTVDVTMDIDCQSIKQSVTAIQATTDYGVRALFVLKCLWNNNGSSRISVQNTAKNQTNNVENAFAISYFPPIEDWYETFLRNFIEGEQSKSGFKHRRLI